MRPDAFITYLPMPGWVQGVVITVSVGPIADAASSLWVVVQSLIGGTWEDVGGLVASGNGAVSSASTNHPVTTSSSYRLASNVSVPDFSLLMS